MKNDVKNDGTHSPAQPLRARALLKLSLRHSRHTVRLLVGLGVLACLWSLRGPLQEKLRLWAVLANDAPPHESLEAVVESAADPWAAWLRLWNAGALVHRQAAMSLLPRVVPRGQPLPKPVETALLTGALDADFTVREGALALLWSLEHPMREPLTAVQLRDADPEARLLGLRYLRRFDPRTGIPAVASLLDDPDPLVLAMGLKLLERWSGSDFGVRLRDAVVSEQPDHPTPVGDWDALAALQTARARASAWWEAHRARYPASSLWIPAEVFDAVRPVRAPDFRLRTLEGSPVRLRDLRGRTVVLNFWTTWCPACVGEIETLKALRQRHGPELVVWGISLDALADDHGHAHPALVLPDLTAEGATSPDPHAGESAVPGPAAIRARVQRVVRARDINYPVLIDFDNRAGAAYNGGELPTTVVVDSRGFVRRRFVGKRSLATMERFVAEAAQPGRARVESSGPGINTSPQPSHRR